MTTGTNRLCYVGQALYLSGQQMGAAASSPWPSRARSSSSSPPRAPANIQPRYDGAASVLARRATTVKRSRPARRLAVEGPAEKAYLLGNKTRHRRVRGGRGSTRAPRPDAGRPWARGHPGRRVRHYAGHAARIKAGPLDFTIDQDPYLQGFLPCLYLYLYNLSGGLLLPPDTDTGLAVVTKDNVGPVPVARAAAYQGCTAPPSPRSCRGPGASSTRWPRTST